MSAMAEIVHPLRRSVSRGLTGYCPACGHGKLFWKYLKVNGRCEACDTDLARYPADDGPAYLTILVIGHLVVAPMLVFPFIWQWPVGLVLATTLPILFVLTLTILPLVKGAVVGGHWAVGHRHPEEALAAAPPPTTL